MVDEVALGKSHQFYIKHKDEIDSVWRMMIAHQKKHGGPYLQVHQRLQLYLNFRIGNSDSHLTALKKCLRIHYTELPEVMFTL